MFTVLGIMIAGILTGYFLRRRRFVRKTGICISATIVLLLFLLGISVGTNRGIMENLADLGWQAFLISGASVLGSVCCAWTVYKFFFNPPKA